MMRVLTDVFPPHIKPVRDGWYLTLEEDGRPWLREFRQGLWRYADGTARLRKYWKPWRGLAFCPYAAIATTHTDVSIASQRVYEIEGVFLPGASCS